MRGEVVTWLHILQTAIDLRKKILAAGIWHQFIYVRTQTLMMTKWTVPLLSKESDKYKRCGLSEVATANRLCRSSDVYTIGQRNHEKKSINHRAILLYEKSS